MKALITNNPVYWKKVEYTTAGTYTLTIPNSGKCKVILVGGGGGGAKSTSYGTWSNSKTGGSGSMIKGDCILSAGNYTVVVGGAGTGKTTSNGGGGATSNGTAGGSTTFEGNTAGGGGGAYTHTGYYDSKGNNGSAGSATVVTSGLNGSNGTAGSSTSRYETYGGGGSAGANGQSGYAAFEFISDSSDYTYVVDNFTSKLPVDTVRKYYKYGTTPNVTLVGSPTVNNGIVSGFSTSNYLTFSKTVPTISSFEQIIKIQTGVVSSTQAFSAGNAYVGLGTLKVTNAAKIQTYISSNGSSNDIASGTTSSNTLAANTVYWIRFTWDGSTYTISVSTDGSSYTPYITISNSNPPKFSGFIGLGTDTGASNKEPFSGSIDLTQSYIKINNQDWWHGTLPVESTSSDYDFYKDVDIYKAFNV